MTRDSAPAHRPPANFLAELIAEHLEQGRHRHVVPRCPPEPNGYLHIGHAKSICLNFGLARAFKGRCHLRFDDTNPSKENDEYVRSIQSDVLWLGSETASASGASGARSAFQWDGPVFFASDYFEALYGYAEELIRRGKAYVDSLTREEVAELRGTLTEGGRESPYRSRSVAENLDLFRRMRAGEFAEGEHVLRMKGNMQSPNMKMRDLPLYRIMRAHHHRTGDAWCVYPLYDFAHCLSDYLEGITHSICTLEFENNREVYDWLLDALDLGRSTYYGDEARPHQYEFARLALTYTMTSKRKLLELVEKGLVSGWDDPRMPTLAGHRRRGYTPEAIRDFIERVGVSRNQSVVDVGLLEWSLRQDLEARCERVLGVLDPLEVELISFPDGETVILDAPLRPEDGATTRKVPLTRRIVIDHDDFADDPPAGWHRLSPGGEVRLRWAMNIRCDEVVRDASGRPTLLRCSETAGRPKGTIHWVSRAHAVEREARLYERLFADEEPGAGGTDPLLSLNPDSLRTVTALLEPYAAGLARGTRFQLERLGYFYVDPIDGALNRTVTLKDAWAKGEVHHDRDDKAAAKAAEKARSALRGDAAPLTSLQSELAAEVPGLSDADVRWLGQSAATAMWFRQAHRVTGTEPRKTAAWMQAGAQACGLEALLGSAPGSFAELVRRVEGGELPHSAGRAVLHDALTSGAPIGELIEAAREAGSRLDEVVQTVLGRNADAVARYRAGNRNLLGFFVGQAMRELGGKADAGSLKSTIEKQLEA